MRTLNVLAVGVSMLAFSTLLAPAQSARQAMLFEKRAAQCAPDTPPTALKGVVSIEAARPIPVTLPVKFNSAEAAVVARPVERSFSKPIARATQWVIFTDSLHTDSLHLGSPSSNRLSHVGVSHEPPAVKVWGAALRDNIAPVDVRAHVHTHDGSTQIETRARPMQRVTSAGKQQDAPFVQFVN